MRAGRLFLSLALALQAASALPGTVIGPADFEALSTGKTLIFSRFGEYYGAEQYLPDRQVIWRLGTGGCITGTWFPQDNDICFVYEEVPGTQCWRFIREAGAIFASSVSGDLDLEMSGKSDLPLPCPAPDMGV